MRDARELQIEIDAAQADLEAKVGELKAILLDKVETPRKVIDATRNVVDWLRRHLWMVVGAVALGGAIRWRRSLRS